MAQKKGIEGLSASEKIGIGFGLTAAAVTAAGAYFLYGSKQAVQNRKKVKGWVLKAKGEVLEALEKAEAITEAEYKELVSTACKAYGTVKNATAGEVKDFQKEMAEHWTSLQKSNAFKKIAVGVAAEKKMVTKALAKKAPAKKVLAKKVSTKSASKK